MPSVTQMIENAYANRRSLQSRSPIVNYETIVNKNDETRLNVAMKIRRFLSNAGLPITESNVRKYFNRLQEDVSDRYVSEMFYTIKDRKEMEPVEDKRGQKFYKEAQKEERRKRVAGKSKFKRADSDDE